MLMRIVLTMKVGAILFMAPPCSTWIFLSRGSTRRSEADPAGKSASSDKANILVMRMCYLIVLACSHGVRVVVEQPSSSLLWEFDCMAKIIDHFKFMRVDADMGAYVAPSKKALTFIGHLPGMEALAARTDSDDKKRIKLEQESGAEQLTIAEVGTDGKTRTSGTTGLKGSAAYPQSFGSAFAMIFHAHYEPMYVLAQPAPTREQIQLLRTDFDIDDGECLADFSAWKHREAST